MRRVRPGDALCVGDGRGRWRRARFGSTLEPDGEVQQQPRAEPEITIGFALVRSDRSDQLVRQCVEAGVDVLLPLVTSRTVVRWDDAKAARHVERWRAIGREAAAQAHRPWLPAIAAVRQLADAAGLDGASLADFDGDPPTLARPTVLVGPEGGWSDDERSLARHRTRLAPDTVLRAETAAVVAGALLVALRGGLVRA